MLRTEDNPPTTWPQGLTLAEFAGTWWVAHTKSRNEKALAHDLIALNIRYFLPMTWKVSRKSRRTVRSLLPLFAGYLFFCGSEVDRLELLRTNRAANIIPVADQQRLVRELVQIEQALKVGAPLSPHDYMKRGQKCRVIAGPLMGLQGIVAETRGTIRLVLQVEMLGQAASVEIDSDMIEKVED